MGSLVDSQPERKSPKIRTSFLGFRRLFPGSCFKSKKPWERFRRLSCRAWRVKKGRLLERAESAPNNLRFSDMVSLVKGFGFHQARVSGSHHIFVNPAVQELVNLQNVRGKAKPYQIRQFLALVERYNLRLKETP